MLLASPFGDNPRKLTIGPNGNLFAAYAAPASLVAGHNGTTGVFVANFVSHESEGLLSPVGVGFGVDGNFYAACQGTNQILRSNRSTGAFMDAFVFGRLRRIERPPSSRLRPTYPNHRQL
jgi:hypothetical protein